MHLEILLCVLLSAYEITDFRPRPFSLRPAPGLYEVTTGLEKPGTVLAAFSYVNTGYECDVLVLNDAHTSISTYLWSPQEARFVPMIILDLQLAGRIRSVIPGDFNNDGDLDLLITREFAEKQRTDLYFQAHHSFLLSPAHSFPDTKGHPAVLDINGDFAPDILITASNSTSYVLEASLNQTYYMQRRLSEYHFQSAVHCLSYEEVQVSDPHSVAFVDLNGDCLADLFLTTLNPAGELLFHIWLNMKNGKYCIVQIAKAPLGAGQVSFADIDKNGVEDLIFPICKGENCTETSAIQVSFNDNIASRSCTFESHVISNHTFIPIEFNETVSTRNTLIYDIPDGYRLAGNRVDIPGHIQTGDFDLDGYPEIMILLSDDLGSFCALFDNIPGEFPARRSFSIYPHHSEFSKLQSKRNAYLCAFFDIDENGVLDILLTLSNGSISYTYSFYNQLEWENLSLKALVQTTTSAVPGAVFLIKRTQFDFHTDYLRSSQLTQSGYFSLQLPYCVFGLGKTTIIVESFIAAIPTLAHSTRVWNAVFPHGFLIVRPYKMDVGLWSLELYAWPGERLMWVMIGALFVWIWTGMWAGLRYSAEKMHDRLPSQQ